MTISIIDDIVLYMENTTDQKHWYEEIVMPALLRHARGTYGRAMRSALEEAGFDDIPGNGLYVIGGLAIDGREIPLGDLIRDLRISKQAAGNLVDALVTRGYLDRTMDKNDRRKLTVILTERGLVAAAVQAAARESIDAQLMATVGEDDISRTRRTLAVLIDIGRQENE